MASEQKHDFNPVSLGILYFSFSLSLWSSKQIGDHSVFAVAIISSFISLAFFASVFSEWVLKNMKRAGGILISLTFLAFLYGFVIGWIQTFSQIGGVLLDLILVFGFAWLTVILLIMVRDLGKQPNNKKNRFLSYFRIVPYIMFVIFLILAGIDFHSHNFWAGGYWIAMAGLVLSIKLGFLKLYGNVFE
jgi:hypothetical protein